MTAERKRKLAAAVKRHYKRLRSQTLPPSCTDLDRSFDCSVATARNRERKLRGFSVSGLAFARPCFCRLASPTKLRAANKPPGVVGCDLAVLLLSARPATAALGFVSDSQRLRAWRACPTAHSRARRQRFVKDSLAARPALTFWSISRA